VTQKIGQLTVRALVLENDGTRVAICSTDFLGFPGVLCDRVRRQVRGIPPENILIGATHNHSGPDCYGFPDLTGRTSADLEYLDDVCRKLAEAINEALDRLQPAHVKIATGDAQGKIAYNYYAEQLFDPRCSVVQFLAASGEIFMQKALELVNKSPQPAAAK
jgi:predicted neutral ceramidase superfamily lipid hydrolase